MRVFTREELEKKGFLWVENSYLEYVFDETDYVNSNYMVTTDDNGTDTYKVYFNNLGEPLTELQIDNAILI